MQQSPGPEGTQTDSYRQPSGFASAETKVKGSRFLAEVHPVYSDIEAQAVLHAVRKRYHDATHHCSAWRVGPAGEHFRADDDGEPTGSAGAPILRQVEASGLTNLLVVVVRWFGGTKLGTGGLVRAYGDAAEDALSLAGVETCVLRTTFRLAFAFEDTSPAMHAMTRFDVERGETRYDERTHMDVAVRRSQAGAFEAAWVDALRGRGAIVRIDPTE